MRTAEARITLDEYLARERARATRHEFVSGVAVAMPGASPRHAAIISNLARALGNALASRPCLVLGSDQRVAVQATGLYTYPDVTVVREHPRFDPEDAATLVNPCVLVEVISDETEAYDRGVKFAHYQCLPSLAEYLLVAEGERRVEHYQRLRKNQWLLTIYQDDDARVALPALSIEVPLPDIYVKLELLEAAVG